MSDTPDRNGWRTDMENAPKGGEGWFLVWCPAQVCGFAVYRKPGDDAFYLWGSAVERRLSTPPTRWQSRPGVPTIDYVEAT